LLAAIGVVTALDRRFKRVDRKRKTPSCAVNY
jgi:hypothetical protein